MVAFAKPMPRPTPTLCVFCDRPAACGWLDERDRLTPVCPGHQWIAVAACGSAQAEFVRLPPRNKKRATNAARPDLT